jgi:phosphomannomutase
MNHDVAYHIGRAYARYLRPSSVVVGHDIRLSGPDLARALGDGLRDEGVNIRHIGQCGTEEVYFSTWDLRADGGIMVTASHNPADYNGMKLVREGSRPISGDTGLLEIKRRTEEGLASGRPAPCSARGDLETVDTRNAYIRHLLGYVDTSKLRPLRVVVNAGNGSAGPVIDALEKHLPFRLVKVHHVSDGTFPNGVPNPLLPENRAATTEAIRASGADFGVAWDGDFDRCFLFDEGGQFIEGYYIVGLLAEAMLKRKPGSKIVHDPRLVWNTRDVVREYGGIPIQSKTGHAFIKERMRQEDAVYGGEMSAHHYFRDFAYCDSGMIPWLLVAALVSAGEQPLSTLVAERIARFPCSGEINRRIEDPGLVMKKIQSRYAEKATGVDNTDGLSLEFPNWRFNLRMSNTEPVIRLNVETRADVRLLEQKTAELLTMIGGR